MHSNGWRYFRCHNLCVLECHWCLCQRRQDTARHPGRIGQTFFKRVIKHKLPEWEALLCRDVTDSPAAWLGFQPYCSHQPLCPHPHLLCMPVGLASPCCADKQSPNFVASYKQHLFLTHATFQQVDMFLAQGPWLIKTPLQTRLP